MCVMYTLTHYHTISCEKLKGKKEGSEGEKQQHRYLEAEMLLYSFLMNRRLAAHTKYCINTNGEMLL